MANLYFYAPTGIYYARPRIKGKVKVECLKTDKLTVAKQRLADFLRQEHCKAVAMDNPAAGKLKFSEAAETFKSRLAASKNLN